MKKLLLFIFTLVLLLTISSCANNENREDYLRKVVNNLEKIESASYYERAQAWQPGDTAAIVDRNYFIKEHNNPADTTIGAKFITFDDEDTTKFLFGYDGAAKFSTYYDKRGVFVDDFTARNLPFRNVSPPFFNYTKSIIKYMLNTNDSITIESNDLGEDVYFKLTIHENQQVEFFGKAFHMPVNAYTPEETTSVYQLWISKSNDLPYKLKREMSHSESATTVRDVELNNLSSDEFNLYALIPEGWEVRTNADRPQRRKESELIGQKAPDWVLNDLNEQSVSLADIKSKVLLINFTGIGCGPCVASLPFLKKLKAKYNSDDFEIIGIETWVRKPHSLRTYSQKHGLNYNLLSATDEVIKEYQTGGAAPVFFILDEQRVVRKVFNGYGKDSTDKMIMDAVKELM